MADLNYRSRPTVLQEQTHFNSRSTKNKHTQKNPEHEMQKAVLVPVLEQLMDICIFGAAVPHSHCLRVWMRLNLGAPVYRSLQAWQVCPARWLATPEEMTTHTPAADQGSSEELLRSVAELSPTLDCCVTTHQCFQHISECKPATV